MSAVERVCVCVTVYIGQCVSVCVCVNWGHSCGATPDTLTDVGVMCVASCVTDVVVIFVACPPSLARASCLVQAVLASAADVRWTERSGAARVEYVVGLDTEWRPSFKKGESNPTSILQVFDMDYVSSMTHISYDTF